MKKVIVDIDDLVFYHLVSMIASYKNKIMDENEVYDSTECLADIFSNLEDELKIYAKEYFVPSFYDRAFSSNDFTELYNSFCPVDIITRYPGKEVIVNDDKNDYINSIRNVFESTGFSIGRVIILPFDFDYSKMKIVNEKIFSDNYTLVTSSKKLAESAFTVDSVDAIILNWRENKNMPNVKTKQYFLALEKKYNKKLIFFYNLVESVQSLYSLESYIEEKSNNETEPGENTISD